VFVILIVVHHQIRLINAAIDCMAHNPPPPSHPLRAVGGDLSVDWCCNHCYDVVLLVLIHHSVTL